MTAEVVPFSSVSGVQSFQARIAEAIAHTAQRWADDEGRAPSAAFWVICDDAGTYRIGWDAESSSLPASALKGIMIAGLVR